MDESFDCDAILPNAACPRGIELIVDQSGLNRSSRDQPEARHYCREPGCKASFKRKYDIDRHYQAKHVQSKHFFCQVRGCKYSAEPSFDRTWAKWHGWDLVRKPLKAKLLANDEDHGYKRWLLHGFHRKDKLLKHLGKDHKELGLDLSSLFEEKDACQGDPIVAETQLFSFNHNFGGEICRPLGRVQRGDGNWTAWSGSWLKEVATAGFKAFVHPKQSSAIDGSKASCETPQASPDSGNASAQIPVASSMPSVGGEMMSVSLGLAMQTTATPCPLESISGWCPTISIANEHVQTLWWPNQQLNQGNFSTSNDHKDGYIPDSDQIMPSTRIDVKMPMAFENHDQISAGLMLPTQLPQGHDNIAGASDNPFISNTSFGDILMDLDMHIDGAHAPAEVGRLVPEYLNAGSSEYFESFRSFDFDAATWNSDNGGYQW